MSRTGALANRENCMCKSSFLLMLFVICVPAKAQQTRVQETNKEFARRFFEEVLDKGRSDRYAESHAKDFVVRGGDHDATVEGDIAAAKEERTKKSSVLFRRAVQNSYRVEC